MSYRIAVDVGGTFTDLVALDLDTGTLLTTKVPSNAEDPGAVLDAALAKVGIAAAEIETFFHGTTYGLNLLLEHKGDEVALITTAGFRDVLEIGRATWPMYRLHWRRPPPLVPRRRRIEVRERVSARGGVLTPLDEDDARAALDAVAADGIKSVAVCLINAYAFTDHEERIAALCAELHPELGCTVSHLVSREYREYERTATTVVEAMIARRMRLYFSELERFLDEREFAGAFMVTRADGGVMGVAEALRRPLRTLTSGPASGVMGTAHLAATKRHTNVISVDMGGTSFDAALIRGGSPRIVGQVRLDDLQLLVPNVEIGTIGAGGGSLARVEPGGALAVGPESAGAQPGPVAYLRGGATPTFTDAALVSGLLGSERFLGGDMALDANAAAAAIARDVAEPLGLAVHDAAAGIVRVVEANMASLLEAMTIESGVDPRDFVLYAYGGGGPLVAASLAAQLGIRTVVVPADPGLFSAWGMLTLDIVHDFMRALFCPLAKLSAAELGCELAALEAAGRETLAREGIGEPLRRMSHSLDMRYFGQEHTLSVPLGAEAGDEALRSALQAAFAEQHRLAYGYALDEEIELVAVRLRAVGMRNRILMGEAPVPPRPGTPVVASGRRSIWHRDSGLAGTCDVWRRPELASGASVDGPAVIEEDSATTFVPAGWHATIDAGHSLILTHHGGETP